MSKEKWYLGCLKGTKEKIYLEDFSWDCEWYWEGGYIGNKSLHCHFDGCFLDMPDNRGHSLISSEDVKKLSNSYSSWEDLDFFLDDVQYDSNEWWRIKDLFKQFYIYKKAAEAFLYGGHCCSDNRNRREIKPGMAKKMNKHIEEVIISEIRKAMNKEN